MVLLLAKQIITLYHAVQKLSTKDQHALGITQNAITQSAIIQRALGQIDS